MFIMTAKLDRKRLLIGIVILAGIAGTLLALLSGRGEAPASAKAVTAGEVKADSNDARVAFLKSFGWDVAAAPQESMQVKIPPEADEVFTRYNELQKNQGFDLSRYAGRTVMRYVYRINNYPGAAQPAQATLLVYKNRIIGGDVTDPNPGGQVRGFAMPQNHDITPKGT